MTDYGTEVGSYREWQDIAELWGQFEFLLWLFLVTYTAHTISLWTLSANAKTR